MTGHRPKSASGPLASPAVVADQLAALNEIARIATVDVELRPMLQRVTDALRVRFGWEFVACISLDRGKHRFTCEAVSSAHPVPVKPGFSDGLDRGIVGEVARTGRSILLDNVQDHPGYVDTLPGTQSELCVPVRHDGETIAILNLESSRSGAFTDQLHLLQSVAEQIAGAIANASLYDGLRHRAGLLEAVGDLSKAVLEAPDLGSVLDLIASGVKKRFGLANVTILLLDEAKANYQCSAETGAAKLATGRGWVSVNVGVVGRAIRTGEAQLIFDVSQDPDYVAVNAETRSELVVPIRVGTEVLGAFDLESDSLGGFASAELSAIQTITDQLAGAIRLATVNRQLAAANARLEEANKLLLIESVQDGLTAIPNRRRFDEALDVEWRRANRNHAPLSLIMIDIDEFKRYNDAYGHQAGDECLKQVAACLRASINRAGEIVARYGGEEFAVILPGTSGSGANIFAQALRARVEQLAIPHKASRISKVVTISLGVAGGIPHEDEPPGRMLGEADEALYAAKRAGRNRVVVAPRPSGQAAFAG
jgi:diguanylate cyclase (GGDEF)-like protein